MHTHPPPAAGSVGRAAARLAVAALLAAAPIGRSHAEDEPAGTDEPARSYAFSVRSGERLFPHARFERCLVVSTGAAADRPRLEPFAAHEGLLLDDRVAGVVLVPARGPRICLVPAFGADPRRLPRPALFARDGRDEPFRLLVAPSIDVTRVADPTRLDLTVQTERGHVVPAPLGILFAVHSRRLLLELPELPPEDAPLVEASRHGWGELLDGSGRLIGTVALPAEVVVVEGVAIEADRRAEAVPIPLALRGDRPPPDAPPSVVRVIADGHFSAARLSVRVAVEPPARFEPARADGCHFLERAGRVPVGEVRSRSGAAEVGVSVRVEHADEAVARRRAAVDDALERAREGRLNRAMRRHDVSGLTDSSSEQPAEPGHSSSSERPVAPGEGSPR